MVVFAQLSTSVSDGQIRLIIMALLVVAVLLAMLTTWYAIKTNPRKRASAAQARRASDPDRAATRHTGAVAEPAGARASASTSPPVANVTRVVADSVPPVADDDDDEWTRLTSPQPPQQQRSTHG